MTEFARMVDLHCHYLPGVDDGAANVSEGLELVRAAHANGISRILLTPHIHVGRYDNTRSSLVERFENFRTAIAAAAIPVEVGFAAEVRCSDELMGMIEREEIPFLLDVRGNKTLLLELPHNRVPPGIEQLVRWLLKKNIRPLIAHPERNKEFIANPQRVADLCKAGCLTQITAAAVIGRFGEKTERTAHWLLDNELVTIIATDAHNMQHRPPLLREAARWVAQRFGDEHAWGLVGAAPAALTTGNFYRPALKKVRAMAPSSPNKAQQHSVSPATAITAIVAKDEVSQGVAFNNKLNSELNSEDFCGDAFAQLRAKLLDRAAKTGVAGSKAARTLALMNELHVR